ncbi:hypothetical protein G9A89_017497 [Geosiphon pyriformis]|nr:hypothetical protein G9A89_017497 [Geosiphon pyriformis]
MQPSPPPLPRKITSMRQLETIDWNGQVSEVMIIYHNFLFNDETSDEHELSKRFLPLTLSSSAERKGGKQLNIEDQKQKAQDNQDNGGTQQATTLRKNFQPHIAGQGVSYPRPLEAMEGLGEICL